MASTVVIIGARPCPVPSPTRPGLLSAVAAHDGGEACVSDLTGPVALSQPTVSHHLKVLMDAGLLSRETRGVLAYVTLVPGALDAVADVLLADVMRAGATVWAEALRAR